MREVDHLLAIVDQAYDRRSWHGTNLRGSIRRVSADEAAWRPAPSRHNIWELVVHAAYWKYAARRRLTGEARGSFPIKGSNWFERPASTVRLPPPRFALRRVSPKRSEGGKPDTTYSTVRRAADAVRLKADTTYVSATNAWRADVELLDQMHRALRDSVARQSPRLLRRKIAGSKDTSFSLISGVAAHDLYHAGQIQLLKALLHRSSVRRR